jgi:hormone-sensitive lipase
MLDDTVMFARRLRNLGNQVDVEFFPDLPHGFLNFTLVSPEAKAASERCIRALKQLLGMLDG